MFKCFMKYEIITDLPQAHAPLILDISKYYIIFYKSSYYKVLFLCLNGNFYSESSHSLNPIK